MQGQGKKRTICNECNGTDNDFKISLPSKAEKVFSLKPGDSSLPPDWKSLLDMPLSFCNLLPMHYIYRINLLKKFIRKFLREHTE